MNLEHSKASLPLSQHNFFFFIVGALIHSWVAGALRWVGFFNQAKVKSSYVLKEFWASEECLFIKTSENRKSRQVTDWDKIFAWLIPQERIHIHNMKRALWDLKKKYR